MTEITTYAALDALLLAVSEAADYAVVLDPDRRPWIVWETDHGDFYACSPQREDDGDPNSHYCDATQFPLPMTVLYRPDRPSDLASAARDLALASPNLTPESALALLRDATAALADPSDLARAKAEALREAADALVKFAEDTYPRDIWPEPSRQDYAEINALLDRERGHMLDGVAADCYRRALAVGASELRDRADRIDPTEGTRG